MDVQNLCPYLIPLNQERTLYSGFIKIMNNSFELEIQLQKKGLLEGASLNCEWKLHQLLQDCLPLLQKRLQQSCDLYSFLVEMKAVVERQIQGKECSHEQQSPQYYTTLVTQLQSLGWQRLQYIDADLQEIHLSCEDKAERKHVIRLKLHAKHPEVAPKCKVDLPEKFELSWTEKSTLSDCCNQFESLLTKYQEFWDIMDEIDSNTWVLEPEVPMRSATYRRIGLGNNASIQITLDVKCPNILPECRFLGADHVINPLRDNLNQNIDLWDSRAGVLYNLKTLLEVDLPTANNVTKDELSIECGICYSYRLEGVIPDQVCDDQRCGQPFHQVCLYEWLRAVPTSRQSFNVIFGECPYCNKPITVKMPT